MSPVDSATMLAAANKLGSMFSQIGVACDEWFSFLSGPPNPPFSPGATFKKAWGQFFRVLSTSSVLTGVVLGIQRLSQKQPLPSIDPNIAVRTIVCFALFAFLYGLWSKLFRIVISLRQAFFCLSLATIPFVPLFSVLRWLGPLLKALVVVGVFYILVIYIFYWLTKAIAVTAECGLVRTMLSVLLFAAILVWAVFWF